MAGTDGFRDLSRLTGAVKAALAVYLVVAVIGMWSGWLEIEILQRAAEGGEVTDSEAEASDTRQAFLGIVGLFVFAVTAIFFLRWTYLANRNLHALGAVDREFTPGWAVGWYFVPIAHLWKPYQALRETFKASHPDFTGDWARAPHPPQMTLWWSLWILGTIVGQAAFRIARNAETVDGLLTSSWLTFSSDAIDVPLVIVVIVLVSKMQLWQAEKHSRGVF